MLQQEQSLAHPLTSTFNKSIWQRELSEKANRQSTQCAAPQIHFRVLWVQVALYVFQESTSSKWSLSDADLYECRKVEKERQKTRVTQEKICLQMYLLTPFGRIAFSQSFASNLNATTPLRPDTHTHTHVHIQSLEARVDGDWLSWRLIDLRRCRQMINSLWVVLCIEAETAKLLTLEDLSSPSDSVRQVASEMSGRVAISELPAALYPHRKRWPVLILILLVYMQNTAKWDPGRYKSNGPAGENSGFKSHNFLITTFPSDCTKQEEKGKSGALSR